MFYIFNKENECIASCSVLPDIDLLKNNNQVCIEDDRDNLPDITMLRNNNGEIEVFDPGDQKESLSYDELLEKIKNKLNNDRTRLENEDIKYKDKKYQVDQNSLNKLMIAKNIDKDTIEWKTSDNTMTLLTKEDIDNILCIVAKRNTNILSQISYFKDRLSTIADKRNNGIIDEEVAKTLLEDFERAIYYVSEV